MTKEKNIIISNIYYMLAYAFQELKQNNYAEIKGEDFENIYDLFAEILSRGISYQLKQGLYREYVLHNESLLTVKGKINMSETIRNMMRNNQRISCDYDTLTEDNIYNQILVATTHILLKHSDINKETKDKLKILMWFFHDVSAIDVHTIRWDGLKFDRNNKNYRMLLYLCYFIVREWLLTTEKGDFKMQAFTDDHLCRLFEKFVLAYYKKHHPELKPSAPQIRWNIIEESTDTLVLPIMQTDILLTRGDRTLIIDTKYYSKILQQQYGKETIRNNNLYQIRTYINEYDRDHRHNVDGMLLYAKTKNDDFDDATINHRDGYSIFIRTLNLDTDFESIKQRLESFVK